MKVFYLVRFWFVKDAHPGGLVSGLFHRCEWMACDVPLRLQQNAGGISPKEPYRSWCAGWCLVGVAGRKGVPAGLSRSTAHKGSVYTQRAWMDNPPVGLPPAPGKGRGWGHGLILTGDHPTEAYVWASACARRDLIDLVLGPGTGSSFRRSRYPATRCPLTVFHEPQ